MRKSVQKGKGPPRKAPTAKKKPATGITREKQASLYEKAMKLFHSGQFAKAAKLFESVDEGPHREMAHAARAHRTVCERRLAAQQFEPSTPEERYDYAIALINGRRFEQAREHLTKALAQVKDGDHIHYALAICYGVEGDIEKAADHLRRAVELQPKNMVLARSDPDFAPFAQNSLIREILYPERAGTA